MSLSAICVMLVRTECVMLKILRKRHNVSQRFSCTVVSVFWYVCQTEVPQCLSWIGFLLALAVSALYLFSPYKSAKSLLVCVCVCWSIRAVYLIMQAPFPRRRI